MSESPSDPTAREKPRSKSNPNSSTIELTVLQAQRHPRKRKREARDEREQSSVRSAWPSSCPRAATRACALGTAPAASRQRPRRRRARTHCRLGSIAGFPRNRSRKYFDLKENGDVGVMDRPSATTMAAHRGSTQLHGASGAMRRYAHRVPRPQTTRTARTTRTANRYHRYAAGWARGERGGHEARGVGTRREGWGKRDGSTWTEQLR